MAVLKWLSLVAKIPDVEMRSVVIPLSMVKAQILTITVPFPLAKAMVTMWAHSVISWFVNPLATVRRCYKVFVP